MPPTKFRILVNIELLHLHADLFNNRNILLAHIHGLFFSNGKLGCQECKNIKNLGLHAEQRSCISREWTDCNIFPSTTNNREKSAAEAQKYLR